MAAITTRETSGSGATVKGLPLSNAEIDTNFLNLNNAKLEISDTTDTNTSGAVVKRNSSTGGFAAGPVQISSLGIGTSASGTSGEIRATNAITSYYSDERLKENIELISNALDKVRSLRGVTYEPNAIAESFGYKKESMVGVLAQDVEKVLPEAVKPAPFDIRIYEGTELSISGEHYKTVQYEKLVPLLIEAIKELSQEVETLKASK